MKASVMHTVEEFYKKNEENNYFNSKWYFERSLLIHKDLKKPSFQSREPAVSLTINN